jgi:hypothetical protein
MTGMFTRVTRRRATLLLAFSAMTLAGCSVGEGDGPPQLRVESDDEQGLEKLGFPSAATRNTLRVGGGDAAADAAGVSNAVFPATSDATRPNAVVLVGSTDWQGGVAASAFAAAPIRAPILVAQGGELPAVTTDSLERLTPKGAELAKGAQVLRIGDVPEPGGQLRSDLVRGTDPYQTAAAVDRVASAARGEPSEDVIVASGERPEYAMPAAAWSANSGDAVLLSARDRLPTPTRDALRAHERPNIYVLGPRSVISPRVEAELRGLGKVTRVGAETPVQNAIAFARFESGGFGWGVNVPGFNFTLASTSRPLDAAAAAALGTNGVFAPLLLTDRPDRLPAALESYFLDVQPGFEQDSREGVYNRVWILGDDGTISREVQGRIDELTELIPVDPEPKQKPRPKPRPRS